MDYVRYLHSKQTVDDRALNLRVLQSFETHIHTSAEDGLSLLRIVEVGAGVGAMFMRLLQRNRLLWQTFHVDYTLIDIKEEVLSVAHNIIQQEATRIAECSNSNHVDGGETLTKTVRNANISGQGVHHVGVEKKIQKHLHSIRVTDTIQANFVCTDALQFLKERPNSLDAIIAAAVLDLWDLQEALPILFGAIDPQSPLKSFYFPINFDGTTDFFPQSCEGSDYDNAVEHFFHHAMGTRKVLKFDTLSCHTGRRLIAILNHLKANILSMGASSWIVSPQHGGYAADEQYFLGCIINFVHETGNSLSEKIPRHDMDAFHRYVSCRKDQVETAELIYVAHNIDFFGNL